MRPSTVTSRSARASAERARSDESASRCRMRRRLMGSGRALHHVAAPAGLEGRPVDALEGLVHGLVGVAGLEQGHQVLLEDAAPLLLPALGLVRLAGAQEPDQ